MGGYYTDTYNDNVKPVLSDWLTNSNRGRSVTDLPLSLANRAVKNLWMMRPWSDLVIPVDITLLGNSYTFPATYGRLIDVYADMAGNGVPSYWYYNGDNYEHGFVLRNAFAKSTGHSWTIAFYFAQSSIKMRYQKLLDEFTGTGTEYCYFPSNLIILEAQKINTLEKGNSKEYAMLNSAFEPIFHDYCNCNQWVCADASPRMNDRNGNEVMMSAYSLDGTESGIYSPYPNSMIL